MHIIYHGPGDILGTAFFARNFKNGENLEFLSATSGEIMLENHGTGAITTIYGNGFPPLAQLERDNFLGTVTGWKTTLLARGTTPARDIAIVSGLSVPLMELATAISMARDDDYAALTAILSRQDIVIDASAATEPFPYSDFHGVTSNLHFIGSKYGNAIGGSEGNDVFEIPAAINGNESYVGGTAGNDQIILSLPEGGYGPVVVSFDDLIDPPGGFDVEMVVGKPDGRTRITGPGFTTTLVIPEGFLSAERGGLLVTGSHLDDLFEVDVGAGRRIGIMGLEGADSYNLTLSGDIRLYFGVANSRFPNTSGLSIDLAASTISNDGYGNSETLVITDGPGRLEVVGTVLDDTIIGSDRNEVIFGSAGKDTLAGGGGIDALSYAMDGFEFGVTLDARTGIAQGLWNVVSFTHRFTGFEFYVGSDGNDVITGSDGSETIRAGRGNDTVRPGNNDDLDEIDVGIGQDVIQFTDVTNGAYRITHRGLGAGIVAEIDTATGQGRIDKAGGGMTTLTDVGHATGADGLAIVGTASDDNYRVNLTSGHRVILAGGAGTDRYEVTANGGILQFDFRHRLHDSAGQQAVRLDLSINSIGNDGYGNAESLTLTGAPDEIQIRGTDFDDVLIGSNGRDLFRPGMGNTTLNGLDGIDTLRYDLGDDPASSLVVNLTTDRAHLNAGGRQVDHVIGGIENLHATAANGVYYGNGLQANGFRIGTTGNGEGHAAIYADSAGMRQNDSVSGIYRLYIATLARQPDDDGLRDWTQKLLSGALTEVEVARNFVESPEFLLRYGALDNADFVERLYNNVLDRASDEQGKAYWLSKLDGNELSRGQVVLGFSNSQELIAKTEVDFLAYARHFDAADWTDNVYRLYRATLDREPDVAGLSGWAAQAAQDQGLQKVAAGFVESPEFQLRYGALDDTAFVKLLYNNVLKRDAEEAGLTDWLDRMSNAGWSRVMVTLGFSESMEFTQATRADFQGWMRSEAQDDVLDLRDGSFTLWGGMLSDTFVFNSGAPTRARIMDFESWDRLAFRDFGYADANEVLDHMVDTEAGVRFSDGNLDVLLLGVAMADLTEDNFIL